MTRPRLDNTKALTDLGPTHVTPSQVWAERPVSTRPGACQDPRGRFGNPRGSGVGDEGCQGVKDELG